MRRLDRFFYTTGLYDGSALIQRPMYARAKELKSESRMYLVFRAIGNRFTTKTDYNFGLENYFTALKYASTNAIRSGLYQNIAYVYAATENNEVALKLPGERRISWCHQSFFPKPFVRYDLQIIFKSRTLRYSI